MPCGRGAVAVAERQKNLTAGAAMDSEVAKRGDFSADELPAVAFGRGSAQQHVHAGLRSNELRDWSFRFGHSR